MAEQMLIEAMKELGVIEKRIAKNAVSINEYAAVPENERIPFGDKESQRKEVKGLVQANRDLVKRYLELKQRIEVTNLRTRVEINSVTYTISELLVLKRKLSKMMVTTYTALNPQAAQGRVNNTHRGISEKRPTIEVYYDEADKVAGIREWDDLYHTIDARLEVINATTALCPMM